MIMKRRTVVTAAIVAFSIVKFFTSMRKRAKRFDVVDDNQTIFVGPIYSIIRRVGETIRVFNVFAENEISLHIFMTRFVENRDGFRYDTFFPHYVMLETRRVEIIEGGAVAVSKEGEESCIHDWSMKALE